MKFKVYKRRGWAIRICKKYEWHTIEECFGGYTIRPMTPEEKSWAKRDKELLDIEMRVFAQEIPHLMNSSSTLYSLLRKR